VPPAQHGDVLQTLDKLDKIGRDGVYQELAQRGIDEGSRNRIRNWIHAEYPPDWLDVLEQRFPLLDDSGRAGFQNIREILALTKNTHAATHIKFEPSLARGLSYYTGAIMEVNIADLAGSLGGGGRYDNLVGMFSGQQIPACGFSLGLERILVVMTERGMFPPSLATSPADVMVAMFDASGAAYAMRVADELRAAGLRVLVYPDPEKIGKQIKYADGRGIPFVALLGEDEIKAGTVTVKDLARETQQAYVPSAAGAAILEALKRRG
jgi:histidyl-tRNA synthetase